MARELGRRRSSNEKDTLSAKVHQVFCKKTELENQGNKTVKKSEPDSISYKTIKKSND